MSSTTYHHFGDVTKMLTAQGHFAAMRKICALIARVCNIRVMVRNAGQLPEPFWLGVACGGGSCSAARCAARA